MTRVYLDRDGSPRIASVTETPEQVIALLDEARGRNIVYSQSASFPQPKQPPRPSAFVRLSGTHGADLWVDAFRVVIVEAQV